MLTFFLNGKQLNESDLDADLTLLHYLRSRQQLSGTKEGCASGDCGACTVLIGDHVIVDPLDVLHETPQAETDHPREKLGHWQYRSANACILFMTQIEGKSIVTVDALANQKDLHPAQQALVELHGSQCGFCTPGFVMSMAGLYENKTRDNHAHHADATKTATGKATTEGENTKISRHEIEIALSGNLCRCTGYRPIIDACEAMFDESHFPHTRPVQVWQPEPTISANEEAAGLKSNRAQSWAPTSEKGLKALLAEHPDAKLLAGGTDLALNVTQMHQPINKLISLSGIDTLKTVTITEDNITIGAAATYSQLETLLTEHYPEFGDMLNRLGSRQIRNSGTLGGNIANASPIGDTPPVLIALGADITLANAEGERRMPLDTFFIDYKVTQQKPGEYVQAIHLPRLKNNEQLKVYKISKRLEDDISAVLFAARIMVDDGRVTAIRTGFGGMAAIPKSAPALEQAITGEPLSITTFTNAAPMLDQDFSPIDDVRASADYRLQVAKGLVQKCALELLDPERLSRVEHIHTVDVSYTGGKTNA